jgi:hypothetical protein
MNRTERLREQEVRAKEKLSKRRKTLADIRKARRAEEKRLNRQRYWVVGALADTAGLLALSNADLAVLFAALKPLVSVPNPGAVLEALLSDTETLAYLSGNGCAQTPSGVAPTGAIVDTVQ